MFCLEEHPRSLYKFIQSCETLQEKAQVVIVILSTGKLTKD